MQNLTILAKNLKKDIGCHIPMIGNYVPAEVYQSAQQKSDTAQNLAKYLINHLANRQHAKCFASAVGMPAFFKD